MNHQTCNKPFLSRCIAISLIFVFFFRLFFWFVIDLVCLIWRSVRIFNGCLIIRLWRISNFRGILWDISLLIRLNCICGICIFVLGGNLFCFTWYTLIIRLWRIRSFRWVLRHFNLFLRFNGISSICFSVLRGNLFWIGRYTLILCAIRLRCVRRAPLIIQWSCSFLISLKHSWRHYFPLKLINQERKRPLAIIIYL